MDDTANTESFAVVYFDISRTVRVSAEAIFAWVLHKHGVNQGSSQSAVSIKYSKSEDRGANNVGPILALLYTWRGYSLLDP